VTPNAKAKILGRKCFMEKYKQLSMEEHSLIQSQLTLGFKPSWIALSRVDPIGWTVFNWV
jgi:hypothetical protein